MTKGEIIRELKRARDEHLLLAENWAEMIERVERHDRNSREIQALSHEFLFAAQRQFGYA